MKPELLLSHADRLLANNPDEADLRRSVSGYYYALFNLLTLDAAFCLVPSAGPGVQAFVRRSIEHRGIARVCQALLSAGRAQPKWLAEILPQTVPAALVSVADIFVELQASRLDADYALEVPLSLPTAMSCQSLVHRAFALWPTLQDHPATQAFLVALAFSDRLTRRG